MSVLLERAQPATAPGAPERRPVGRRMRRVGLWVFFASITVNAALGIYALVSPDWGETQGRILGTSLCVTGAILLALACAPAWERGRLGPVPYAGTLLGIVGFGMAIGAIWSEPSGDTYGKALGSVFVAASACVVASLLVLARLRPARRWVFTVTLGLLAVGATMLGVTFWLGDDPSELYLRAMGVVLIAFAAFAVSVPVLHWIDRGALAIAEATTDAVRFCPHCGGKVAGDVGADLACARCGREFRVASASFNLT